MSEFSLIKFFKQFPDETKAAQFFENLRWGETIVCPYCGSTHISRWKLMPYRCKDCRKHFSVKIKTAQKVNCLYKNGCLQYIFYEVDETYIGGKEKNKHNSKKLKEGRGTIGKQSVIGLKSRIGKVKSYVIYAADTKTLTDSIRKNVETESHVYTDEWRAYKDLDEFNHQKVNHSVGEFVNEKVFTNGIESGH